MRRIGALALLAAVLFPAGGARAQEPAFEPVGSIADIMREIIYPMSDELFYVMRAPPETDLEWNALRRSFLVLAESGNLIMMEGRSIPRDDWMDHARELVDVSVEAYEAAGAKDLDAVRALSPRMEASCRACHEQYHPRYRRRAASPPDDR